jgi:hypothetical protein
MDGLAGEDYSGGEFSFVREEIIKANFIGLIFL